MGRTREGFEPRRRWPMGGLGALVLILLVEGYVARHRRELADDLSQSWRAGARLSRSRYVCSARILILGDSLVKLGVQPRLLEQGGQHSAASLALLGGPAPASYVLLRRSLANGARPMALVVDFHPNLLSSSPSSSQPYWADLLEFREGWELATTSRAAGLAAALVRDRFLPSLPGRFEIREALSSGLLGTHRPRLDTRAVLRRNWRVNQGAQVSDAPAPLPEADPPLPEAATHADWRPHPTNDVYVRRFLELAEARQLTTYWLLPPTTPAWQRRREALGVDAPFERYVRSLLPSFPHLVIVDGRHAGYDRAVFIDATHLGRRGAIALTHALGKLMTQGPGPTRWLDLPRFEEPADEPGLEDLGQSRRALGLRPANPPTRR